MERTSRLRAALLAAAGVASVAAAGWLFSRAWTARDRNEPSGAPGEPALPAAAAGAVNVRVQVRVLNAAGADEPVGTALPRRVSLHLKGAGGQPYEAPFDRVGLWLMETPPGTFAVPAEQTSMGEWKWSLTGTGVAPDGKGGWTVRVDAGVSPTLVVILR